MPSRRNFFKAGALAAGADPAPWRRLGECLGSAYQIADDLYDACADEDEAGKPRGQDSRLSRPSLVAELGLRGAYVRLQDTILAAQAAIPPCQGARELGQLVQMQATRLAPKHLARTAA